MENNHNLESIKKMYPYGDFPHQYTKKQKEADINNPKVFNYFTNDKFDSKTKNMEEEKKEDYKNNNLDISKILPLLTNFKKGGSNQDMLSTLLPLLLGNKSKDFNTILKLLNNKKQDKVDIKTNNEFPKTKFKSIDSYKRIE